MENLKLDNTKLNTSLNPALSLPRLSDGSLNLEAISTGKNAKGNYIFPDFVIETYYKELPDGSTNESNNKWVYNGGILNKATPEVQKQGGEALQAKLKQRRTIQETIKIMLAQKATKEEIEAYNLPSDATKQDAMTAAMLSRAIDQKDVNAFNSLRDTAGEKPTDKIDAEVTQITPEIEQLIKRVASRNEIIEQDTTIYSDW